MIAAPAPSQSLAERLLAATDDRERRSLIDAAGLDPHELHDAVLALQAEAERVMGSDVRRMERLCLDALALAERADDDYLRAMATMRHGDYFRVAGRNAEARDRYDAAAAIFTRLGRPVEAARTRIGWVWATAKLGRPDEALAVARKARSVLLAQGESFRAGVLDLSVAQIQHEQGQFRSMLRSNSRAGTVFQSMGETGRISLGRVHAGRAIALTRLGRYAEALSDYDAARAIYRSMGETVGAARVTRNRGEASMELGRYAAALRSFEEARDAFRSAGLSNEAAQVAPVLAECYLHLNRPADALASLDEAESDLRRTDAVQVAAAIALRRVAAHNRLNERAQAQAALDEAERRLEAGALPHRAWLAEQRAALALGAGAADALPLARHARSLAQAAGARPRVAAALLVEGAALLALGAYDDAARAGALARRLSRTVDVAPLLARTHELLGRIAEARGRSSVARREYARAIDQIEREQRGVIFEFRDSFAAERGAPYERLVALHVREGRHLDAFRTVERAKSRALADAIAGVVELRPRGSAEARRLALALDRARGEYAAAAAESVRRQPASEAERERNGRRLAELERTVAGLVRRLQLAGADDAGDLLGAGSAPALPVIPPGTVMVEYFISGDDIVRLELDHAGVRSESLAGALPEVRRLLSAFRLNVDTAARTPIGGPGHAGLAGNARTILSRLHDRLLGGMDGLETARRLVVIPHGPLHYLPFHALFDGARYLVERMAVSYAPSAALHDVCHGRAQRPRRSTRALVLGHSGGGQLPHAVDEAGRVGELLGVPAHVEGAATRAVLARDGRRAGLIHIAAHGAFRPDAPLFSGIELADGPLTTADIFGLKLPAALVALSACDTGRAVVGGGDELAGLVRAFLYAGCAGLLVSQWRVEDAATAALMSCFYRRLATGATPAAALRAAQVDAIRTAVPGEARAHPFSWAGFQVVGGG